MLDPGCKPGFRIILVQTNNKENHKMNKLNKKLKPVLPIALFVLISIISVGVIAFTIAAYNYDTEKMKTTNLTLPYFK